MEMAQEQKGKVEKDKSSFKMKTMFIFVFVLVIFIVWTLAVNMLNLPYYGEFSDSGYNRETSGPEPELLKIGHFTDAHCYGKENKDTKKWELNWRCQQPMESFVSHMNEKFWPDVVIEGGDFVDGRDDYAEGDFVLANKIFNSDNAPNFHVIGNHEKATMGTSKWLELAGYEKAYYSFDIKGYRIIVLDSNFKPTPDGGAIETNPESKYGAGYIDSEQLTWLEKILQESQDMPKLVFVHHPPLQKTTTKSEGELFTDGEKIRKLFSQHKVTAVIAGHIEEFCSVEVDGVKYFTLQGFHKANAELEKSQQYKEGGVFSEIELKGNELSIKTFYNQGKNSKYDSMQLNQQTAICNNNSLGLDQ